MARRTDDKNSASSQFFIMQGNYPEYDGQYAAFGTALDEETLSAIGDIAAQPVDGAYHAADAAGDPHHPRGDARAWSFSRWSCPTRPRRPRPARRTSGTGTQSQS